MALLLSRPVRHFRLLQLTMSAKDKNKKRGSEFRNEPFRTLKGIRTRPAAQPAPPPHPSAPAEEDDGEQLFLRAAQGARRIDPPDREAAAPPAGPAGIAGKADPAPDREERLFREAMSRLGASSIDGRPPDRDDEAAERRLASSRMRQLKRGTIRIAGELDLHGYLRDEAVRRLAHFVESSYARGAEAVLVITGKGLNSPDGPVLQGAVQDWLRTAGKRMVAEFHAGPRDKGGSGALVVFLRRRS